MWYNNERALNDLMNPAIIDALLAVREYRGKQELYFETKPDELETLCEIAKIQSTGASNRIEDIATTPQRLRELMSHQTVPKNRDEREILGYRYVLDMIHSSYQAMNITPGLILQLHRDMYRMIDVHFAGRWKDSDNIISERTPTGEMIARFIPTSAAATPGAIEQLCEEYKRAQHCPYDALLISLLYIFDFLSIHPFSDGNGRMSRLLTLLLLYRNGYLVGKYISIEAEIERTKETYYEALQASSIGWNENRNDYMPIVTYYLGILLACYKDLDHRMRLVGSATAEEAVLEYFAGLIGDASKRDIVEAIPTMSTRTADRILQHLQERGIIEKVGAARATKYRRIQ